MKTRKDLIAPCGLDCFNCEVHESNITEETRAMLAEKLGLEKEKVSCRGCRQEKGVRLHFSSCATYDCAAERGVEYCFECPEFPCEKLQPAADGAERYPHNIKVYNLCRMKLVGVEKWAGEEAAVTRERYFRGRFIVGGGPVIE